MFELRGFYRIIQNNDFYLFKEPMSIRIVLNSFNENKLYSRDLIYYSLLGYIQEILVLLRNTIDGLSE